MSQKQERKARKAAERAAREEQQARKVIYYIAGALALGAIALIIMFSL